MAKLNIEIPVPRNITIDSAKERISHLFERVEKEAPGMARDLRTNWNGCNAIFSFKAKGVAISGTMIIGHNEVMIDIQLPWFASSYKGKITEAVSRHANNLLAA